jgi:hypothetical protein
MALREFTDARGTARRVWVIRPISNRPRPAFANGWLTFEQVTDFGAMARRRLTPIPDGWVDLPKDGLRGLCLTADPERSLKRVIQ